MKQAKPKAYLQFYRIHSDEVISMNYKEIHTMYVKTRMASLANVVDFNMPAARLNSILSSNKMPKSWLNLLEEEYEQAAADYVFVVDENNLPIAGYELIELLEKAYNKNN